MSTPTLDLPLGLRTSIESGNAVLFLGAGTGYNATDEHGGPAPDGGQLALDLASNFGVDTSSSPGLSKVAQVVELRKGRAELQSFLAKRLGSLEPDEHMRALFEHRWAAIFTTNYDRVIERAYELDI